MSITTDKSTHHHANGTGVHSYTMVRFLGKPDHLSMLTFSGKHDDFCFVCGSAMELFECQTCSSSYHAACMTPSVSPEEIPNFWFCPHCVDNELNIPQPPPSNYFTPPPPLTPSTTASRTGNSVSDYAEPPHRKVYENSTRKPSRDVPMIDRSPVSNASPLENAKQPCPPPSLPAPPAVPETTTTKAALPKANANRPKRTSYSPPRKKSKYSAFSSDVDKALVVIHKELEAAAKIGKSENDLRDQIKVLEQGMRLKDSQLALTTRELELARKGKGSEAELRVENEQLRELVKRLNESLAGKDRELKEWREKLKSMIGE